MSSDIVLIRQTLDRVRPPINAMLEAGLMPRQVAAIIGNMMQREARGAYQSITEESGYQGAAKIAYEQRDTLVSKTAGFVPNEAQQHARKTLHDAAQIRVVMDVMPPAMRQIRQSLESGKLDRRHVEAASMAFLAASNDAAIERLGPRDTRKYFDFMFEHSLAWLRSYTPHESERPRIKFHSIDGNADRGLS